MAYTDPDTGITRDKHGKVVSRDPSATAPRSGAGTGWGWVLGVVIAAVLMLMLINMTGPTDRAVTGPDERPITEPLDKAPPPATP